MQYFFSDRGLLYTLLCDYGIWIISQNYKETKHILKFYTRNSKLKVGKSKSSIDY